MKQLKIYDLYFTRQMGLSAPLLTRIETISANSINEARVIGEEKCQYYAGKSNRRYVYTCEVSEGRELEEMQIKQERTK